MFSRAVRVGTRLNAWKTKPRRSRRKVVSALSDNVDNSVSPMKTWPEVTVSSAARQCSNVDLPEPDGPMIAVKRPEANSMLTSSRALTAVSPCPYLLVKATARAAGPPAAAAGVLVLSGVDSTSTGSPRLPA